VTAAATPPTPTGSWDLGWLLVFVAFLIMSWPLRSTPADIITGAGELMKPTGNRKVAAMTLIEVLMVVAVLFILAALLLPGLAAPVRAVRRSLVSTTSNRSAWRSNLARRQPRHVPDGSVNQPRRDDGIRGPAGRDVSAFPRHVERTKHAKDSLLPERNQLGTVVCHLFWKHHFTKTPVGCHSPAIQISVILSVSTPWM